MKPRNKTLGYLLPVFALCVFMLVIYGAYVPHKPAEIQRVVCIKFKAGTTNEDVEKHLRDFASMKNAVKDVVAYSAGHVQKLEGSENQFDVIHYLTFRTKEGAAQYAANADRKQFVKANEANWDNVLEMNSNIEK
ncbi:Dabb family protein [Dyadobacter chenwenxiniae]|uniref:Dabb family protein n=1 Tax=Dyadobacter chenwenxiniae TaxID=2906456 RepID=A0A9X1TF99_9BACT|nr:Dabb family protein [Dyadobacter chenwenxiniae]MCF0048722.1 Dabb family protein [Dyadobacter chenwenxiniae]MCF0062440.1 Dabb family protein [Dyadobacter chenwenxiniae]UON83810.1 Dabb family protein [Dyadobacter chenwenxiniae]